MTEADYLAHYGVLGMKWGHRNAETLARYARGGVRRSVAVGEKAIGRVSDAGGRLRTATYAALHKHRNAIAKGNPTHINIERALNSAAKREARIRRDVKNVEARAASARSIERTKSLQAKAERKLDRADEQRDYQQRVIDKYGSTSMRIVETQRTMPYLDKRKFVKDTGQAFAKAAAAGIISNGTLAAPILAMEVAGLGASMSAYERVPRKHYEVLTRTDFNELVSNLDSDDLSLKKQEGRYV